MRIPSEVESVQKTQQTLDLVDQSIDAQVVKHNNLQNMSREFTKNSKQQSRLVMKYIKSAADQHPTHKEQTRE